MPVNPESGAFPVRLEAGAYLVVFASGKDRRSDSGRFLHTNFAKDVGRIPALVKAGDADELKTAFTPSYPQQVTLTSYGRLPSEAFGYLRPPTPGRSNATSEVVSADISPESITFSPQAGVFFGTEEVTVSGEGRLRYTLDGSVPTSAARSLKALLRLTGPP